MWSLAKLVEFFHFWQNNQSHMGADLCVCVCVCVCVEDGGGGSSVKVLRCWHAAGVWAKWDGCQPVWWLGQVAKLYGPQVLKTLREFRMGSQRLNKCNLCEVLGVLCPPTMYSMLEAGGYTWPRSLLWRSRMSWASLSVMALFPLCLASHQSPSSSRYLSRICSQPVEFGSITMEVAAWSSRRRRRDTPLRQCTDRCLIIIPGGGGDSAGVMVGVNWRRSPDRRAKTGLLGGLELVFCIKFAE